MRIVMFGYQTWGKKTLEALLASPHEIALAVTHPRSEHEYKGIWSESVEDLAKLHNIPIHITEQADDDLVQLVSSISPDIIIVNSWYTWLPASLYNLPKHGTINLHDSLLPKFSGFSPVLWALISGESEFGLTVHRMDEGLDTGDILLQLRAPIRSTDTATELVHRGMDLIPEALTIALARIETATATWTPQDPIQRTYFHKRSERDSRINWETSAEDLERFIRALSDPYPNAYSYYRGERIYITKSRISVSRYGGTPGRVIPEGGNVVVVVGPDSFRGNNTGLIIEKVRTDDGEEHSAKTIFSYGGYFTDHP
ncbi:MAG: methionyl-tRNA formyltransferase [Mycobacteriaceae bacterium]